MRLDSSHALIKRLFQKRYILAWANRFYRPLLAMEACQLEQLALTFFLSVDDLLLHFFELVEDTPGLAFSPGVIDFALATCFGVQLFLVAFQGVLENVAPQL